MICFNIKLKEIDERDISGNPCYSISFPLRDKKLENSLKRLGQINPVIVCRQKDVYCVVSGVRRIRAALKLGWDEILARQLTHPSSPEERFILGIEDNLFSRKLNAIEISNAITKANGQFKFDYPAIIEKIFPLLEVEKSRFYLERYLWLSRLPEKARLLLVEKKFLEEKLWILSRLYPQDAAEFLKLAIETKAGLNVLREIVENCIDISRLKGISPSEVLQIKEITAILSAGYDRQEKLSSLREKLFQLRYPNFSELLKKVRNLHKELKIPSGMHLRHHPLLERRTIQGEFSFRTPEELIRISEELRRLASSPQMKDYIKAVRDTDDELES